ncbi:vitamin B12-dependent ribonucleotide reductase [candidate division KSB1 bacterium]|nr:vitamin B12-dependent ribonucleotide reductase [candidate division KSB1 bacterium]
MKKLEIEQQLKFDEFDSAQSKRSSQAHSNHAASFLKIPRHFTKPGEHPYDQLEWKYVTATITNDSGKVIFKLEDTEAPATWTQTAINIVASKYFHTFKKNQKREKSIKQLIDRVVKTLVTWGQQDGYFAGEQDVETYEAELTHLLVNQKAAFNSPVWFNMGVEKVPQCSACFINSVQDTMESILNLARTEGLLFKWGSGTGTNFSSLRSSKERLSTGGLASGPVSFMKGYDAFAGVIKSGGKTRRAAKMVIMDISHPDILEFINCKVQEEKKAWSLIDSGYDGSFGGEAYSSVFFQNSNNSIRVTDDFMRAVETNGEWETIGVTHGKPVDVYRARNMMKQICEAAHLCGDPGIQFHSTINNWHTCPESGLIRASNPCSEYMFLDDSACNLASLNLLKFVGDDGTFQIEAFRRACHIMIIAQEIIVSNSSYPTDAIKKNSDEFRPLGLGYANLGALLMFYGLAYDSDAGRALAASITSLLTGQAYLTSAIIASSQGPFAAFEKNKDAMLRVISKHMKTIDDINKEHISEEMIMASKDVWADALEMGHRYGYRNAQVSVLAPTGTIGFMMDCDTTGIEPDIALVKYKKLAGGGQVKLVNNTVGPALARLGYTEQEIKDILDYLEKQSTIEGAPQLKEGHLSVFDCAIKPLNGNRSIHHMGHIKMMAAVQPFLSGAISKTVNMPNEATPEDIEEVYMQAWKLGLKSIAIYRDGSKRTQPLNTGKTPKSKKAKEHTGGVRKKLPDERRSLTHKFSIAQHEGYITVGEYEDGTPGEIFIVMAKEGSVVSGLMDSFATAVSIGLQYGVPLRVFVNKYKHTRFEPYGFTNNKDIPMAKSISDYIFRWLGQKYLKEDEKIEQKLDTSDMTDIEKQTLNNQNQANLLFSTVENPTDAPPCPSCGSIMVRSGTCHKCMNCGETSGCS